ncbi:transcriptional regulator [Bacillus sp. OxB-1]|uniref:TetR/AcrR family transcriptional regulator n=1 Tax=Bacillus sp. (strain OxB-1) TaxID=98228 RepID=UPI000582337E|nr:TetR family transcriptional regulator [Bacillus sp. OxB-1]BAQ09982.1 transcriptional regulator [Bacillus sp. OxB-1]
MPKQTFFNLPIDKQEMLIDAAMIEFSRAPLHEATISNIVKHAGIARGSFYQYFEDKEDLFFYLLEKYTEQNEAKYISLLQENDGDLFEATIQIYQFMLQAFQNQEHRVFIENAFLNMNHKIVKSMTNNEDLEKFINRRPEMIRYIDQNKLNITEERELYHVLKIIDSVTLQNLIQNFALELTFEESLQNYVTEIDLLKKGLARN